MTFWLAATTSLPVASDHCLATDGTPSPGTAASHRLRTIASASFSPSRTLGSSSASATVHLTPWISMNPGSACPPTVAHSPPCLVMAAGTAAAACAAVMRLEAVPVLNDTPAAFLTAGPAGAATSAAAACSPAGAAAGAGAGWEAPPAASAMCCWIATSTSTSRASKGAAAAAVIMKALSFLISTRCSARRSCSCCSPASAAAAG